MCNKYEIKTVRDFDMFLILYYSLHEVTYIAASQWRSQKIGFFFGGDEFKVKPRKGSSYSLDPQKICVSGKAKLRKGSTSLELTRQFKKKLLENKVLGGRHVQI